MQPSAFIFLRDEQGAIRETINLAHVVSIDFCADASTDTISDPECVYLTFWLYRPVIEEGVPAGLRRYDGADLAQIREQLERLDARQRQPGGWVQLGERDWFNLGALISVGIDTGGAGREAHLFDHGNPADAPAWRFDSPGTVDRIEAALRRLSA